MGARPPGLSWGPVVEVLPLGEAVVQLGVVEVHGRPEFLERGLLEAAYASGFSDQSHMIWHSIKQSAQCPTSGECGKERTFAAR